MSKTERARQRLILQAAQAASARGDVDTARRLFASVGIGYVSLDQLYN